MKVRRAIQLMRHIRHVVNAGEIIVMDANIVRVRRSYILVIHMTVRYTFYCIEMFLSL